MANSSIIITKNHVKDHYGLPGLDAVKLAEDYVGAWLAKVESGTTTTLAKMKCALADGPCGCPAEGLAVKCTGPYPPVPVEIILETLKGMGGVKLLTSATSPTQYIQKI